MDCCIVPPNSRTCHQLQLNRLRDLAVATATCLLGYNEWYVKGGGQQQRPGKADPLVGWEEGRNQRPQPLQELVLGGVLSPGEVSSPGLWPAVVWWSERNVVGINIFESLREGRSSFITTESHTGRHHWCSALSGRVRGRVEQRSLSRYLIAIICVLVAGWRLTEMVCTSRCLPGENVVNYGEREGGAHIFQKILSVERGPRWRLWWPSFGFEAGASKRRGHWRLERFFDKISLKSFYTFCESESFLTNFSLFLFYMFSSW